MTKHEAAAAWNNRPATVAKSVADGLADALEDSLAFICGRTAGVSQRNGILQEGGQALTEYRKATQ
jgi:hypothetical protein